MEGGLLVAQLSIQRDIEEAIAVRQQRQSPVAPRSPLRSQLRHRLRPDDGGMLWPEGNGVRAAFQSTGFVDPIQRAAGAGTQEDEVGPVLEPVIHQRADSKPTIDVADVGVREHHLAAFAVNAVPDAHQNQLVRGNRRAWVRRARGAQVLDAVPSAANAFAETRKDERSVPRIYLPVAVEIPVMVDGEEVTVEITRERDIGHRAAVF